MSRYHVGCFILRFLSFKMMNDFWQIKKQFLWHYFYFVVDKFFFQLVSLPFHGAQTFKSCQYWIPALDTPDPATPRSTKYFLRMSSQRISTELKEELENCRYAVLLRWSDMSVIVGRGWRVSLISNYAHKCNAHILQAQSSVGFIIYLSTELKTRYLHSSIVQTRTE